MIKSYWSRLNKREKIIVAGGGALLMLALAYFLLVDPFRARLASLRQAVPLKRAELTWMVDAARQAERLKGVAPAKSNTSPLKLIDINARKFGIADNLKRLDPGDSKRIKVWFEDLAYVDLMSFLRALDREHNIEVIDLTAEKQAGPGLVNARVTFRSGR